MAKENKPLIIFLAGKVECEENISRLLERENFDFFAADGGYCLADKLKVNPKYILGDFDSSLKPNGDHVLVYPCEKDETDSELALHLALKENYREIWMIAPFGGRLDHTIANLALLAQAQQAGANLYLYDGINFTFLLGSGEHYIDNRYRYVSFFAYGEDATVSLKGFKYELDQFVLKPAKPIGISNQPSSDELIVRIFEGQVLCVCIEKEC